MKYKFISIINSKNFGVIVTWTARLCGVFFLLLFPTQFKSIFWRKEGRGKERPPFVWVKLWDSLGQVWDKASLFPEEHCHTSTPMNVLISTHIFGGNQKFRCLTSAGGPL